MESQQMMELLLKEIRASQEDFLAKMEATRKKYKEEMEAKLDAYQAKTDAVLLAMQVMETSHMEKVAKNTPERDMETIACKRWRHV
jgi:L-ribulose-5-phosphate 3-epimerase UlaE